MSEAAVRREFLAGSGLRGEALRRLQERKLRSLVRAAARGCPAYEALLRSHGVHPAEIRTLDDLPRLPVVEKSHIVENAPWGWVSAPQSTIARFIESSGSTGKPKLIAVSEQEKKRIFELSARSFYLSGVRGDGVIYPALPHGPWASAFFVQNGCERIGPTVPAEMSLPMAWHAERLKTYRPKYLITSPSFAAKLVEESGVDFPALGLKRAVVGAEGCGKRQRSRLEEAFSTTVLQGYGCTEIGVAAAECEEKSGLHYFADEYIIEVVDPKTREPVAPGEKGEMLVTCLFKDSMPMIRYAMRDMISLLGECSCGLGYPLMSHILGRSDDMMTLGAANVYPHQVMDAVTSVPELSERFQFIVSKRGLRDHAVLRAELRPGARPEGVAARVLAALKAQSSELVYVTDKARMIADPEVEFVPPGSLAPSGGGLKLRRFVDEREIQG